MVGAFTAQAPAPTVGANSNCSTIYTQAEHRAYARAVYKRPEMSRTALRRVERMRRCQSSPKAVRNALRLTRELRRQRRVRQEVAALLPYDCGSAGHFAIPCKIVACESRYSATAYNPSGAYGYYQMMPMWLGGDRSIANQHRAAARLWNGGAGASNWVCA